MNESGPPNSLWVEKELAPGQGLAWTLGLLRLSVVVRGAEWQVTFAYSDSEESNLESVTESLPEADTVERYAAGTSGKLLRCSPALADRSVVVRPRVPVFVPPGEAIRFYVSSPIWARIEIGKPWLVLREVPVRALSDTWFGPRIQQGGLAYALATQARSDLNAMPKRSYRAITPVEIRNGGKDMLPVERLNLPVPYLSLFSDSDETLWTETVTMNRSESYETAALEVGRGAPSESTKSGNTRLVTGPRAKADRNLLVHAFSSLLHSISIGDGGDTE